MGMFDDIIVPKSYLKSLLTNEQEKLIKSNRYQTKSLENFLGTYKVYRQKLFVKENKEWIKDTRSGKINFYTSFRDKDKNTWWGEFEFTLVNGVVDKKELIKFEIQQTAQEKEEQNKNREEANVKRKISQRTFKYRFFAALSRILRKLLNWSEQKVNLNLDNL